MYAIGNGSDLELSVSGSGRVKAPLRWGFAPGIPMEVLWRSYGVPMEYLWSNRPSPRHHHAGSKPSAAVQPANQYEPREGERPREPKLLRGVEGIHSACFLLYSRGGPVLVWGRSGGGLTWIAQGYGVERLTRLARQRWVRLSARCIDDAAPAQPRCRPGEAPM